MCYYRGMREINRILTVADRYARARRILPSTLGRLVTGSATFFDRLEEGRVTIRRAEAAIQWFSDHWIAGLEWPPDIPRPEPAHQREEAV